MNVRPTRGPIHREVSPFLARLSASANSSRRSPSPRTTRSASRSSRSCARACWRAWMCEEAGFDAGRARDTVYWVALLRYVGCTGHAHEVATVFGDEIAIRAQTLVHDAANPAEVMRDVVAFATAGHPPGGARAGRAGDPGGRPRVGGPQLRVGLRSGRHAGRTARLRSRRSRRACASPSSAGTEMAFPPARAARTIPLAMRVVHLSHDMEAIGRLFSPAEALEAARERRDRTYDPALADLFAAHGQLVRAARQDGAVGCRARPRAETAPHARRRPNSTTPSRWRPTSST